MLKHGYYDQTSWIYYLYKNLNTIGIKYSFVDIVAVAYHDKKSNQKFLETLIKKMLLIIPPIILILIPSCLGQGAIFENDLSANKSWISEPPSDIFRNASYNNAEFQANRANDRELMYLGTPSSQQRDFELNQSQNDSINNYCHPDASSRFDVLHNDQRFANESFQDLLNSQARLLDCFENLVNGSVSCTRASLTTNISNPDNNNELVWTWKTSGSSGKLMQVQYRDPLQAKANLSLDFDANMLTVNLATDATQAITTTANDIKAAVSSDPDIAALFDVQDAPSNDGSIEVTAMNATFLANGGCNGQVFVTSFEDFLKAQTRLFARFEELLYSDNNTGWNESSDTRLERATFLKSYMDLLRKEALLFLNFKSILKTRDFLGNLKPDEQVRVLDSFQSLLKEQIKFYKSFNTFEKKLDADLVPGDSSLSTGQWVAAKKDFTRSFEDLMMLGIDLNGTFQGMLKLTDWMGSADSKISSGSTNI